MAEFGIKATELSAPQGAGANPVAPVRQQFVDTSIMPLVTDVANVFMKGMADNRKAEAEAMKTSVVGSYVADQERINAAVASGQMRPDIAATRSRALFGQYAASNAAYIEDISKARMALSGGSELGAIEDKTKAAADIQKMRVKDAQESGAIIYPWMDAETTEKTLRSSELAKQQERAIDRQIKMNTENRAMSAEERTLAASETKKLAQESITGLAGSNIDRMSSLIKNLSDKVSTGMPYEEATLTLASEFAKVEGAIQSVAGVNPELAAPYRSLFNDLKLLGDKAINPKTRAEATKTQYDEIINRAKLAAVTSDPKMKAVVVANELLGGNAVTALNATAPITKFIANMSKTDVNSNEFVDQVVGNPEVEKDVLKFLESSIKKVNEGSYTNKPQAEKEAVNSTNQILKQTGEQHKAGKLDVTKMDKLAKFFASSEYGRFSASGKLDRDAAQAAKMAWENTYEKAVEQSIGVRIKGVEDKFANPPGLPINAESRKPRKLGDLFEVKFTGSGVTFQPKPLSDSNRHESQTQKFAVQDLNSITAGINQAVHIGAHLDGHTDYAKHWEENKHTYLPQLYSPPVDSKSTQLKFSTEAQAVAAAQLTPEENRIMDAYMKSDEYISELKAALAVAPHPQAKAALTAALETAMKR
jgi:hypothetical protein